MKVNLAVGSASSVFEVTQIDKHILHAAYKNTYHIDNFEELWSNFVAYDESLGSDASFFSACIAERGWSLIAIGDGESTPMENNVLQTKRSAFSTKAILAGSAQGERRPRKRR